MRTLLTLTLLLLPSVVQAEMIQYIFVTRTTVQAKNPDIDYYNNVVQTAAQANPNFHGMTFHAIISTPTVDARVNAPWAGGTTEVRFPSQAVFRETGESLYDYFENYYINFENELGFPSNPNFPFTGSDLHGYRDPGGDTAGSASGWTREGYQFNSQSWIDIGAILPSADVHTIYALSTLVPEPDYLTPLLACILTGTFVFIAYKVTESTKI